MSPTAFSLTPEEAQTTASTVLARLQESGHRVEIETALSTDAPYRTTLLAKIGRLTILVEAQGTPTYTSGLRELALWLGTNRKYVELNLAVDQSTHVALDTLASLKRDGVGLILVNPD